MPTADATGIILVQQELADAVPHKRSVYVSFYVKNVYHKKHVAKQIVLRSEDIRNPAVWRALAKITHTIFVDFSVEMKVVEAIIDYANLFDQIYVCNCPKACYNDKGIKLFSL